MRGAALVHVHRAALGDKCGAVLLYLYMDTREAGRMGAKITNEKLTTEKRRKAARMGWKKRKARLRAAA